MPNVSVSQLKMGDRLSEDVITKLGSVLFPKGRMIQQREQEILEAFLIATVSIEPRQGSESVIPEEASEEEPVQGLMMLYKEYDKMFQLMRRIFTAATAGGTIPILDIRTTVESLIRVLDFYNVLTFTPKNVNMKEYVLHNSILVAMTSYMLARWHGFSQKDFVPIVLAGIFHDIGNAKVDPGILEKPGRLNAIELDEMKRHTLYGYQILKNVPAINEGVKLVALQHHERLDGSGYPLALSGDKIHPYAKVIAIADIYHAMTSHRQYRRAESAYLVLEQLLKESFGKLDPAMVQTFINKLTALHNGTLVRLSDQRIGEIVFTDRNNPTRPMVSINGLIVNLATERSLFIQEVIRR